MDRYCKRIMRKNGVRAHHRRAIADCRSIEACEERETLPIVAFTAVEYSTDRSASTVGANLIARQPIKSSARYMNHHCMFCLSVLCAYIRCTH